MFTGKHDEIFTHSDGRRCLNLKDGSWVTVAERRQFVDCTRQHVLVEFDLQDTTSDEGLHR